jgi:cytochrome c-type biogenesis protein CcmH/NrfG
MTPREEQDLFNQAVDLYTRQQTAQARALFEKIVASDPGNVEAQAALRRIKEEQQ